MNITYDDIKKFDSSYTYWSNAKELVESAANSNTTRSVTMPSNKWEEALDTILEEFGYAIVMSNVWIGHCPAHCQHCISDHATCICPIGEES